jgi:hypothetical protein
MSSTTQMQTLNTKFNDILLEYQNTYQEYLNTIDSSSNYLTTVDNLAYNGGNTISQNRSSGAAGCLTSCQDTSACTGGTFDASRQLCTLTSGKGNVIKSPGSSAILQQSALYSYKLQSLNSQLINLNKEISNTVSGSFSGYHQQQEQQDQQRQTMLQNYQQTVLQNYQVLEQERDEINQMVRQQQQTMLQNYQVLEQERDEINQMVRQFQNLDGAMEEGEINVTMYYYNYVILAFIVIILVILLIKYSFAGLTQRGGGNRFMNEAMLLLGIMVVFLGLSNVFKNLHGFIFVAILVIAYLITKLKIINS